jgi:hypothetical protein
MQFLPALADVKAHSGFLYVAQSMAPDVLSAIRSYTEPLDRICFTGHSAGGAVASLLYLNYQLSQSLGMVPPLQLVWNFLVGNIALTVGIEVPADCITFAAPPSLSIPDISATLSSRDTQFLAFVAHGDPVPRADRPFVRQLLQIYSTSSDDPETAAFQFDPPELFNAGNTIVLFDNNADGDEDDIVAVEATAGIGEFLWGNVKMHNMKVYLELLSSLQAGANDQYKD